MKFLIRLLVSACGLWISSKLISGIYIDSWITLVLASFILGLVNAVIKPILVFLTFPITVISLGIFLVVINGAMIGLVAWTLPGFAIAGLFPAILCWLIMAFISGLAHEMV